MINLGSWMKLIPFVACWIGGFVFCHFSNSADDREVIQRSTNSVWYDSDQETVTPVGSTDQKLDVSDRHDSVVSSKLPYDWSWLEWSTSGLRDLLTWIFSSWKIVLIVFFLVLLFTIAYVAWQYTDFAGAYSPARKKISKTVLEREAVKIQDLPFEIVQSALGLLGQAEKYRAASDYSRAIVYLYSHVLVELDEARCIRLAKGKTNRMYLRELKDREMIRHFTNQLVTAFEFTFFGKHQLDASSIESIWNQLAAFESELKRSGNPTSFSKPLPPVLGGVS